MGIQTEQSNMGPTEHVDPIEWDGSGSGRAWAAFRYGLAGVTSGFALVLAAGVILSLVGLLQEGRVMLAILFAVLLLVGPSGVLLWLALSDETGTYVLDRSPFCGLAGRYVALASPLGAIAVYMMLQFPLLALALTFVVLSTGLLVRIRSNGGAFDPDDAMFVVETERDRVEMSMDGLTQVHSVHILGYVYLFFRYRQTRRGQRPLVAAVPAESYEPLRAGLDAIIARERGEDDPWSEPLLVRALLSVFGLLFVGSGLFVALQPAPPPGKARLYVGGAVAWALGLFFLDYAYRRG